MMTWITNFAEEARKTDRFSEKPDHAALLAAGLMGEAGSMLAELKKEERERNAYPAYRRKMLEEMGDFLWYFVRLVTIEAPSLLAEFEIPPEEPLRRNGSMDLPLFLEFGSAVGEVLAAINLSSRRPQELVGLLRRLWIVFVAVSRETQVSIQSAAEANSRKIESRWPSQRVYADLFDKEFLDEERLPRRLDIEFVERSLGDRKVALFRCNGINFGDRISDNIQDPDGYRYHDAFHFAYAVHLGWSPVVRALLRCKRKSSSKIDEGEDGARAAILEEAVAAVVFSRAKQLNFFDGLDHLDYDLLKTIKEFVQGYEVEKIHLWQWEVAILDGYRAFRQLRSNRGGRLSLDLERRELAYTAPR